MSPVEYRKTLLRYRTRMAASPQIDDITYDAYVWWMNKQLAEIKEENKKAAIAGRLGLRVRLKNLLLAIVAQDSPRVKGVSE
jgi:hypothetical protein